MCLCGCVREEDVRARGTDSTVLLVESWLATCRHSY